MFDEEEDSQPWILIGGAVAFAVLAAAIIVGGSLARQFGGTTASAPASAEAANDDEPEMITDLPLTGELLGNVFFGLGQSQLSSEAQAEVVEIAQEAKGAKQIVLAGFHDPSGNAAQNAELAKNRALAVRTGLIDAGVRPSQILLRRPESTTGDGSPEEARRVDVRLLD